VKDTGMKRLLRFLIRLYPTWWRRRYGRELEALLEDSGSGSRDAWDLFQGAMEMQMSRWSFGRIVAVCGIVGVMLAGTVAFSLPYRYQSTTILKIPAGAQPIDRVNEAAQVALNRNSLTSIINQHDLYLPERKAMPMEDVVERMHRSIQVTPVMSTAQTVVAMAVRFAYQDPSIAQQVTQTLAARFAGFEVLDPASAPQRVTERKRYGLAGLGLPAGMLFGVVLALIVRRSAPGS
jgi:hypothetical protein